MNTVSKRFLIAVIAACALLLGALCASLDFYVGSSAARERLETAAQRTLGLPVKIGAVHYNFWSGLRATGITADAGSTPAGPSSLSLPSVSAQMAFWPLFSGRVVVRRLVFNEPSLILAQNPDGGWKLPLAKPADAPDKAPKKPSERGGPKGFKPEFSIRLLKVENARLRFVEKGGKNLCVLKGVTGKVALETPGKAAGHLAEQRTTLHNGLTLEAFRAPFTWEADRLTLSPLAARLAEGSVGGAATLGTTPGQPSFTLDLKFDGVKLNRLLAELGEGKQNRKAAGTLHGNLDLYGLAGQKKSIQGTGQARLRGGRMEQIPLVQMIGNALQMEVSDIELRQAQLDLRVGEEKILVDSLVMESPSIGLTAKGTSAFDGKLDLAARLALNPKLSRRLPGWVDANFQPVPGGDWRDIGFAVTGTLARPETDLLQVMVGRKLGDQFMNLLQSVTGRHKKKSGEKKAPQPEPSPAQGEEPQPAATP